MDLIQKVLQETKTRNHSKLLWVVFLFSLRTLMFHSCWNFKSLFLSCLPCMLEFKITVSLTWIQGSLTLFPCRVTFHAAVPQTAVMTCRQHQENLCFSWFLKEFSIYKNSLLAQRSIFSCNKFENLLLFLAPKLSSILNLI